MKDLLLLLLIAAVIGLGFYVRQQATHLDQAQQDNAALQAQLSDKTAALQTAQATIAALRAASPGRPPMGSASTFARPAGQTQSAFGLQDSALDRPAYNSNGQSGGR